jgi:2-keto-4-pentenoate hydratase/2-oxohepta-3-ene-1,7-dioic acid hydratase in catechol pathway
MKFVSYKYKNNDFYGIFKNDNLIIPMNTILDKMGKEIPVNLLEFIQKYSDSILDELNKTINENDFEGIPLDEVKITAPIPNPRRNVFCLGKNYADHAMEVKSLPGGTTKIPDYPIYFTKVTDPAIGPMDDIIIPYSVTDKVDYEAELAIIISKDGKDIKPENAEEYIFGYTIVNDVSAREIQTKHVQWFKGKSFDTFTPMGPYIVDKLEIKFPVELDISCKVNNELRQSSNTKKFIFDIPYIISDLSNGMTLRAGDIILTGTPAGVGMGFNPPRFLKSGDIVECYIERIGTLVNKIK